MLNIVLFGPPGSGKGTQSSSIVERFQVAHLSTGDIFRANIKGETELGQLAKSFISQGKLVPDEVTISMLESEVNKNAGAKGFIFDGFPRTTTQAEALDRFLSSKGDKISVMIALEVPEEELRKRLASRAVIENRPDDADPAVIQKRIDVYNAETMPVKDFYQKQGKLVSIDGVGSIENIFDVITKAIEAHK